MKRTTLMLFLFLFVVGVVSVMAHSDTPSVVEQCQRGETRRGCAEPEPTPFELPPLPTEGCYVTPAGNYTVTVYAEPDNLSAPLGHLEPGVIYPANAYIMLGQGTNFWFYMTDYEGSVGTTGFVSLSQVITPGLVFCPEAPGRPAAADDFTPHPTATPISSVGSVTTR